jgi:hypothetical protein
MTSDPQPLTGETVACPECHEQPDLDDHQPCGEPGCGCWCTDPFLRDVVARVVGS